MSSLWIVVIGVVVIYLAYNYYAKRIDRTVIAALPRNATGRDECADAYEEREHESPHATSRMPARAYPETASSPVPGLCK